MMHTLTVEPALAHGLLRGSRALVDGLAKKDTASQSFVTDVNTISANLRMVEAIVFGDPADEAGNVAAL